LKTHIFCCFKKKGKPIKNEEEADMLKTLQLVNEDYFYIFKNTLMNVQRNRNDPLYEAAYYCSEGDYYVRVQKCHLQVAYVLAKKVDRKKMFFVDSNDVPYWVDRHLMSFI